MDDKCIMENLLTTAKSGCDLYLHGTIESGTPEVHTAFQRALNDTLALGDDIYAAMSAKGWYPTEQVSQDKINGVKQKYAGGVE